MPGYHRLMSIPDNLRAARANLMALLGPDQGDLLTEKLRSLRGEARNDCNWLCQEISDLDLAPNAQSQCDKVLHDAEAKAEKLPDKDVQGDQYAAARADLDTLLAKAHDELAKILPPADQSRLGPKFDALAPHPPTTQPAN
jgi:hypothetical protein